MPPSHRAERRLDVDLLRSWPLPADDQHDKRARGTVLVIGGSDRDARAPCCSPASPRCAAAPAACRSPPPPEVAAAVAVAVPEALVTSIDDDRPPTLVDLVGDADASWSGPG